MMTRKYTTAILALGLVLAMLLVPGAARAQETVELASLSIRAWPEFDDPSVLLIIEGQALSFGETEVTIPLPPGARINAAAYPSSDTGELLTAEFTQTDDALVLQTPTGAFWIEIYDPGLTIDGEARSYAFDWTTPFDINTLTLEVQTPFGARNMEMTPAGGTTGVDQFNLPISTVTQQGISAGDTVTLEFSYTKSDPTLSADWIGQTAPSDVAPETPTTTPTGPSEPSTLVVILLVAGGLALVGGGVWYFIQASQKPTARRVPAKRSSASGQRFCTQCGKPIEPGDKFCRHCGAKA